MTKEQEVVEKLLSFAFAMSGNMIGLTKGNYDEKTFVKKTYEYLQKYTIDRNEQKIIKQALQRLNEYEQLLGSGRLTDRNYKNTTLDLDSCKPYLRLGQLEDIYEECKSNG